MWAQLPDKEPLFGTISEEEARKNKGIKVFLDSEFSITKIRQFRLQILGPFPSWLVPLLVVLVTSCLAALGGGAFFKFYVPEKINTYLQSATTCNISSLSCSVGSAYCFIEIDYADAKNESKSNKITMSYSEVLELKWEVGYTYSCIKIRDSLKKKQDIELSYTVAQSHIYAGFLIPGCIFSGLGIILIMLIHFCMYHTRGRTIQYYSREIIHKDNFKIVNLQLIPEKLHEMVYVLLYSYYATKDVTAGKEITFLEVKLEKMSVNHKMLFGCQLIPILVCFFLASFTIGMRGYDFDTYKFGLTCVTLGLLTCFFFFPLWYYLEAPYFLIRTAEFEMRVGVRPKEIFGFIELHESIQMQEVVTNQDAPKPI